MGYIPGLKAIKIKKNDNSYLRSKLKWSKKPTYYEFGMQDLEIIDLRNGKNTSIGVPEVKFKVDLHGNFLGSYQLMR